MLSRAYRRTAGVVELLAVVVGFRLGLFGGPVLGLLMFAFVSCVAVILLWFASANDRIERHFARQR